MHKPPRILEIGGFRYFKNAFPEQTTLLWTGRRLPQRRPLEADSVCTPRRFLRAMREARAGHYDLIVAYVALQSPWHPRHWLRAWARQPLRPVSAISRVFGVWALRLFELPVPVVAIDFNDAFTIARHNFSLLDKALLYFKRELPVDRWNAIYGSAHSFLPTRRIRGNLRWQQRIERMRPISLPAPVIEDAGIGGQDFPEKSADIFFAGTVELNSWVRRAGYEELKRLTGLGIKLDIPSAPLPRAEFHRRMARAWLAWSPSGFGWECFRHTEAPQCLTVPVINHPTIERHQPLIDGVHAIYYDAEPGGLTRAVTAALADKEKLKRMALAAREHVLAHHTIGAMVNRVFESAGLLR